MDSTGCQLIETRLVIIAEGLYSPIDEGAKKTAAALVEELLQMVSSLLVFTRGEYYAENLKVERLPENNLLLNWSIATKLKQFSPDIILYIPESSTTTASFIRVAILKWLSKGSRVAIFSIQPRILSKIALWINLPRIADVIFAQSTESVEFFSSLGCNSIWIPGAVDLKTFAAVTACTKKELRYKYGFFEEDKIILHVGHIKKNRNILELTLLVNEGYRVLVVGSTSTIQDQELSMQLENLGIIIYRNYIEHIEELYQISDCYVFPVVDKDAAIELPLSVLEAMACNLPVVTTPFGGLPRMFSEGNGYLVLNSENKLSETVYRALNEKCETRNTVADYSWHSAAKKIISVILAAQNE